MPIQKEKLIVIILPIVLLLVDLLIGFSSTFTQPKIILSLLLALWMISWWIFEILPLGVTALIPLFYLPSLNILPLADVTPAYSNPVIFLFLGGFIIARGLEKTNLDERFALKILSFTGKSDFGILFGFILATTFLSMWISNTATTVMMVPIGLSVIHFLKANLDKSLSKSINSLSTVLFLSIAYSANIGGIMTPVGTPPNVVFLGYLNDLYNVKVDFWRWILATLPIAVLLLAIMVYLLKKLFPFSVPIPKNFRSFILDKLKNLGPIDAFQKITVFVFLSAATLWIFKDVIHYILGFEFLNDTSIAILCGFLLFLIPTSLKEWKPVLDAKDISFLPWDIVLLFGGGMALANTLKEVGLIQLSTEIFNQMNISQPYIIIFALAALTLVLTEVMSNVALCVIALPMIMKFGETLGMDPLIVAMPAALCSSFAFSMPISTPPNAIVFGTNAITIPQMLRAGVLLNVIALLITMTLGYYLIQVFF